MGELAPRSAIVRLLIRCITPELLLVIVASALTVTLLPMFPVTRLALAMLESVRALLEIRLSMTKVPPLMMMFWPLLTLLTEVPLLEIGLSRARVPWLSVIAPVKLLLPERLT